MRHYHFEGDGCLDDRPLLPMAGAALIRPGRPADYPDLCARLGVAPRAEGWALWHTWDREQYPHTLVTTCIAGTEGLLMNWTRGIDVRPEVPMRAQMVAVIRDWTGPFVASPEHVRRIGLGGT
ncbi:hypothetical protein ACFHW2_25045 [Actinomadura sp. LOL_016]|uniref:hypothetical protein n=1 Tax=unclassified Actinomadura TaxID=2626254 RepID=UPI003A80902D